MQLGAELLTNGVFIALLVVPRGTRPSGSQCVVRIYGLSGEVVGLWVAGRRRVWCHRSLVITFTDTVWSLVRLCLWSARACAQQSSQNNFIPQIFTVARTTQCRYSIPPSL